MGKISLAALQALVEETRNGLVTSNDVAPSAAYPYYCDHPSALPELGVFKAMLVAHRLRSAELIHRLGVRRIGQYDIDFSAETFHHAFLEGLVVSRFGWGDCGECADTLAAKVINAGCDELLFVVLNFPHAKVGMDATHAFLVVNVNPGLLIKDKSLNVLLTALPEEAIIADPFLDLCFSPREIPAQFNAYLAAYGGGAEVLGLDNLTAFSIETLRDDFFPLVDQIVEAMKRSKDLVTEKFFPEITNPLGVLEENIPLVRALSHKTGLIFQAYSNAQGDVHVIANIHNKANRKAGLKLMVGLVQLPNENKGFARNTEENVIFFIKNINHPHVVSALQPIIGVEKVALINVDFKWKDGQVFALEMDDAINRSGFKGYNALHTGHSGCEAMLRKIIDLLKKQYHRIHFIFNDLTDGYWPRSQFRDIHYYDDIFAFLAFAKQQPIAEILPDIVIYGKNHVQPSASLTMSRTINEIQAWLQEKRIFIPVVNAPGMVDAADNKFIFSQLMKTLPRTQLLNVKDFESSLFLLLESFSEKMLLKLHDGSEGRGAVMLTKIELLAQVSALQAYFHQQDSQVPQHLAVAFGPYRSKKLAELHRGFTKSHHQILLQEYIASDPVVHQGQEYDATGRVVLLLRETQEGRQSLEVVDGYWKLPIKPINKALFDEEACLSSIEGDGKDVRGAAKFTEAQGVEIARAFQALSQEWFRILGDQVDFYLGKVASLAENEQRLLTQYFTGQAFDAIKVSHFDAFSKLIPIIPGLDSLLVRTLNAELCSFWSLYRLGGVSIAFLQKELLHFLASEYCPIDFSGIHYSDEQEYVALTMSLKNFALSSMIDEAVKLNAEKFLKIIQAGGAKKEIKERFNRHKDQAGHLFKDKQYQESCQQWKLALELIGQFTASEIEKKDMVATLCNNIAVCYRALENYGEAIAYFELSLKNRIVNSESYAKVMHKKILCENKLKANQDNESAVALYKQGQWQEALTLFESVLRDNQAFFGDKKHLDVAVVHWSVSSCYIKLNQLDPAKHHAQCCYDIRNALLGAEDSLTLKTKKRCDELAAGKIGSVFAAGHFAQQNTVSPVQESAAASNTPSTEVRY